MIGSLYETAWWRKWGLVYIYISSPNNKNIYVIVDQSCRGYTIDSGIIHLHVIELGVDEQSNVRGGRGW